MLDPFLEDKPFLYWNKRGKAIIVKDEKLAREMTARGTLWGVKCDDDTRPGQYNPVYDIGDGEIKKYILPDNVPVADCKVLHDTLEFIEL